MYVSRSQLETYLSTCQYRSYLNYGYEIEDQKIGLSSTFLSIDLACGTAVHQGVAFLLTCLKEKQNFDFTPKVFDAALEVALAELENPAIRDGKIPADNELLLDYSIKEHKWLVEALLYAWFRIELPKIQATKKVILVEKEIELELTKVVNKNAPKSRVIRSMEQIARGEAPPVEYDDETIILGSRCDALFLDLETETFEAQSLKTTKQMGIFTDQMVNRDLQTALEIYALEYWLHLQHDTRQSSIEILMKVFSPSEASTIERFLSKQVPTNNKKVESVRYTFFVKGNRDKTAGGKLLGDDYKFYPLRDNNYLYGYRKLVEKTTQDDSEKTFEYAHSFRFFNPANKSTYGQLGKGWMKFIVAEDYPGGIRQWIDDINNGVVQSDAKNPIEDIIQIENDSRIESHLKAQVYTAQKVALEYYERVNSENPEQEFLANTKSCTWPTLCDFATICAYSGVSLFNPDIAENPIASQLYQIRVPHHLPEKEYYANEKANSSK